MTGEMPQRVEEEPVEHNTTEQACEECGMKCGGIAKGVEEALAEVEPEKRKTQPIGGKEGEYDSVGIVRFRHGGL